MIDFTKTAFLFPGQGSQEVGMIKDVANTYVRAREILQQADDILGFSLSQIMFEGSEEQLGDTAITQPAMYVGSVALLRVLQEEWPAAIPASTAGHSLGEFTALTAAGVLSYEDGLKLVQKRGQLMKEAGEQHPGSMAAILGLEREQVDDIVGDVSAHSAGVVVVANDNCPGQIVISGDETALHMAVDAAKAAGARRALPLAVSVATHSPLMQPAKDQFVEALRATPLSEPQVTVYANVCGCPSSGVDEIRTYLEEQLTNGVLWRQTVDHMIASGIETFVEIGSKSVLTGLLRRIDRSKVGINIQNVASLQAFLSSDD